MLLFNTQDIGRNFDARDINRGKPYQTQGRVTCLQSEKNGTVISALVQGSARLPYHVKVTISKNRNGSDLESECSCPVGYMCKHGVAVLYEAIAQESRKNENITLPGLQRGAQTQKQLSEAARKWIEGFEQTDPVLPESCEDRLVYSIYIGSTIRSSIRIVPGLQHKVGENQWSRKRIVNSGQLYALKYASGFVTDEDKAILAEVDSSKFVGATVGWDLPSDAYMADAYLRRLIRTGRAFLGDETYLTLKHGQTVDGYLSWSLTNNASAQKPVIRTHDGNLLVLPLKSPWYYNPVSGEIGPIDCKCDTKTIDQFLQCPELTENEAAILRKRMARKDIPVPSPYDIKQSTGTTKKPTPTISIKQCQAEDGEAGNSAIIAQFWFDYNGETVNATSEEADYVKIVDNTFIRHPRNLIFESKCLEDLSESHLKIASEAVGPDGLLSRDKLIPTHSASPWFWLDFLHQSSKALEKKGYKILADKIDQTKIIELDQEIIEATFSQSGAWWFSLDLGVTIDGKKTPLLPILVSMLKTIRSPADLEYLKTAEKCYAPMPDGRIVALPSDRVYSILKTLVELYDTKSLDDNGQIKLSIDLVAAFLKLEAITSKRWLGDAQLRKLVESLSTFDGIKPCALPKKLQATLRSYQVEGYNWLRFLGSHALSGILADDMGLGKTIQTLAYIQSLKEAKQLQTPVLIIMPTSLIANWQSEVQRFAPSLKVLTLHGKDRQDHFVDIEKYDVVITTYPLLPRDKDALIDTNWSLIVLDEAQAIKNPSAKVTQAVCELSAKQRLCLTGTPVENHLGEAWSLFTFLMPGLLGDHKAFNRHFRNPIEREADTDRKSLLSRRLRPFVLRRLKAEVEKDLPSKTEIIRRVTLSDDQRDLYETVRHAMNDRIRDEIATKGLARSHIVILDALLKLRQTCCDPRLVKLEAAAKATSSAKLEELMEMIPTLIEEGRRILLFSQFTSMLDLIKPALDAIEIPYVELRGTTKDRVTPITRFQKGDVPLFLISLKAGGTGLNLTAADTVIHYDPWWNPSVENQATDRAHRIGQTKPVFVYKLIAEGTVEERILELQARKAHLANVLFGDNPAGASSLTQDDIKWLLGEVG